MRPGFSHMLPRRLPGRQAEGVARFFPSPEEVLETAGSDMDNARKAWAAVTATDAVTPYSSKRISELMEEVIEEYQ